MCVCMYTDIHTHSHTLIKACSTQAFTRYISINLVDQITIAV